MSLILYKYDTMLFMSILNLTYWQYKIIYIITSSNVISLYDSYTTVFMSFLNTYTVSGYLMTPCCQLGVMWITIYLPILQLLFNITQFNIFSTSPTPNLCKLALFPKTFSRKMTYLNPFNNTNIMRLYPIIPESQTPSQYLSQV